MSPSQVPVFPPTRIAIAGGKVLTECARSTLPTCIPLCPIHPVKRVPNGPVSGCTCATVRPLKRRIAFIEADILNEAENIFWRKAMKPNRSQVSVAITSFCGLNQPHYPERAHAKRSSLHRQSFSHLWIARWRGRNIQIKNRQSALLGQ